MIAQKPSPVPGYRVPLRLWMQINWSLISGKPRSVLVDSQRAFTDGLPAVESKGLENISSEAACLVVCNHYARPGFDAWWIALGISAAFAERRSAGMGQDVHWVMTAAWRFEDQPLKARFLTPLTRVVFKRLARIYGFISMPPMPPAPDEVRERAAAVLRTVRLARAGKEKGILIGLAPEGQDFGTEIGTVPEGAGDFISLLIDAGLQVLPVGVFEDREKLVVSFGEMFMPETGGNKEERDSRVSGEVMAAIKSLLPDRLNTGQAADGGSD